VALIELDLYAPAEPTPGRAPRARNPYGGLALVVVMLLGLAGSAPAMSVLWRRTGLAPLAAPDGSYQLVGGRLYTFDSAGSRLVTTAWSMEPLRRLWSRATRIPEAQTDGVLPWYGWFAAPVDGDQVLLKSWLSSTVVDARTGTVRWTSPVPVIATAGGRVGLVYEQHFRPGTEYDQATGASGPLYFADDGVFHTEPPLHTTLRALDLRTGRQLWQTVRAGPVVAAAVRGNADQIVVVAPGWLGVLAASTGAVLRERRLPGPAAQELPPGDIVGDLVLLRRGWQGAGGTVTAYSVSSLAPVWQRPESVDGDPAYCADMVCEGEGFGVAVLDPATGQPRWRTGPGASLVGRGTSVLEVGNAENRPVRARDAVTGAVQVDLAGWTWYASSPEDAPLVLGRFDRDRTVFGVLPPGRRAVQPLGYSTTPVTNCASDEGFVGCRILGGVEVWTYRW
jgi:outer membrane protein assembly factor BamB